MAKKRVRLKEPQKDIDYLHKARDRSYKEARKKNGGKIKQGYAFKSLLEDGMIEGRQPTIVKPRDPMARDPMFVVQPSLGKRIFKLIRRGYPYTTVCRYVGITPKTLKDWLEKGRDGVSEDYAEFYRRFCKAEAAGEMNIYETLRKHEREDWRVSAWQLERRWPENWSKKDRSIAEMQVTATVNVNSKETLGITVVNDSEARELARKLIDGNEFGYNRLPAPAGENT